MKLGCAPGPCVMDGGGGSRVAMSFAVIHKYEGRK